MKSKIEFIRHINIEDEDVFAMFTGDTYRVCYNSGAERSYRVNEISELPKTVQEYLEQAVQVGDTKVRCSGSRVETETVYEVVSSSEQTAEPKGEPTPEQSEDASEPESEEPEQSSIELQVVTRLGCFVYAFFEVPANYTESDLSEAVRNRGFIEYRDFMRHGEWIKVADKPEKMDSDCCSGCMCYFDCHEIQMLKQLNEPIPEQPENEIIETTPEETAEQSGDEPAEQEKSEETESISFEPVYMNAYSCFVRKTSAHSTDILNEVERPPPEKAGRKI